jgi:hypothetical protein
MGGAGLPRRRASEGFEYWKSARRALDHFLARRRSPRSPRQRAGLKSIPGAGGLASFEWAKCFMLARERAGDHRAGLFQRVERGRTHGVRRPHRCERSNRLVETEEEGIAFFVHAGIDHTVRKGMQRSAPTFYVGVELRPWRGRRAGTSQMCNAVATTCDGGQMKPKDGGHDRR